MTAATYPLEGGCSCRAVRYRMMTAPIVVHACHCTWCQRETGTVHALNAVIEAGRVELLSGQPEAIDTPSHSGKGQRIWRCPRCKVALWSNYSNAGEAMRFIRVGTLDNAGAFPPDIHVFTSTKQPWVQIPAGSKVFVEFYNPKEVWSPEQLGRWVAGLKEFAARNNA
jgi:hypothetical protein